MNELTMVLDDLESAAANETLRGSSNTGSYPSSDQPLQRLIAVLQRQGGDMARLASVITDLSSHDQTNQTGKQMPLHVPTGGYSAPSERGEVCRHTVGNGTLNDAQA